MRLIKCNVFIHPTNRHLRVHLHRAILWRRSVSISVEDGKRILQVPASLVPVLWQAGTEFSTLNDFIMWVRYQGESADVDWADHAPCIGHSA